MKNIKINGISVNDFGGDGSPLVFIHAFPLCSRMWDPQVEYFQSKYRVITYDLRGLGYSNDLSDYLYTMEDLTDDLFSIMDEMKIQKAAACGLSVGGYILLRALVRDQNRFSAVILADTKSERDDNEGLLSRSAAIKALRRGNKQLFIKGQLKKLLSEESYSKNEVREFTEKMMNWMDEKGMMAVLIAIATRTNTMFELKKIRTPALIIAGKEDVLTPPERSFYLREYLSGSVMKVIPGAGHLSNIEAPGEFNRAAELFLSENVK